jgi:hypothetical protein
MSTSNTNFARKNNSCHAKVDNSTIYATGAFKNVYKGKYDEGERNGEDCVAKSFISGSVYEESYFAVEMKVVARALQVINKFNADSIIDKQIWLNEPTVWTYEESKEKVLVEPMIHNFEKFNSNTGWTPDKMTPWIEVMQALSHYSYHSSQRSVLFCDLQGGSYKDGFIITDPVIMSLTREFGPTDLGPEGISTFFARHKCNSYCRAQWIKPEDKKIYYNVNKGTSMVLPTRYSRATLPC